MRMTGAFRAAACERRMGALRRSAGDRPLTTLLGFRLSEHHVRHPAEVTERLGDPFAPIVLPLGEECFHEQPTRVA